MEGHDPCEGYSLHIRSRCPKRCAQFQDGSWLNKLHCYEEHPGLPKGTGDGAAVEAWLEAEFSRVPPPSSTREETP